MTTGTTRGRWHSSEPAVYLAHVAALLWPGVRVPAFPVHQISAAPINGWSGEDAKLLIDEGRRQLDGQTADLDRIRSRAQFLFTTSLAFLLVVLGTARVPGLDGLPTFLAWLTAVVLTLLGLLGSASVLVSRSDLGGVDAASLTHSDPPVLAALAGSYGEVVRVGADTVATRLTVYRDAVWCVTVGALAYVGAWLLITF
jgi:hypothetical protein